MGAVKNNEGGPKYVYYGLKPKLAKFELYKKDTENEYFDEMKNLLLEKVGRRKKKINSAVFWEYCMLFSDLDDEGAKIIITIPNYGDTLMRVFGPLFSLDSISALDFSPYRKSDYFRFAIRKHGEKETVKYPFEWDTEAKWFKGVPKTVWTETVKDGITTNESDDSELKSFILNTLIDWSAKVLGTPFYEAEVGERIFDESSTSTPTQNSASEAITKFIEGVLAYYKDFNKLAAGWPKVIKRAKEEFEDPMTLDFMLKEMSEKSKDHYSILHDVYCSLEAITVEEVADFEDDLPF